MTMTDREQQKQINVLLEQAQSTVPDEKEIEKRFLDEVDALKDQARLIAGGIAIVLIQTLITFGYVYRLSVDGDPKVQAGGPFILVVGIWISITGYWFLYVQSKVLTRYAQVIAEHVSDWGFNLRISINSLETMMRIKQNEADVFSEGLLLAKAQQIMAMEKYLGQELEVKQEEEPMAEQEQAVRQADGVLSAVKILESVLRQFTDELHTLRDHYRSMIIKPTRRAEMCLVIGTLVLAGYITSLVDWSWFVEVLGRIVSFF